MLTTISTLKEMLKSFDPESFEGFYLDRAGLAKWRAALTAAISAIEKGEPMEVLVDQWCECPSCQNDITRIQEINQLVTDNTYTINDEFVLARCPYCGQKLKWPDWTPAPGGE
jgi:uncharacterized protein with PIN domain